MMKPKGRDQAASALSKNSKGGPSRLVQSLQRAFSGGALLHAHQALPSDASDRSPRSNPTAPPQAPHDQHQSDCAPSFVLVGVRVQHEVPWGCSVALVGQHAALGGWHVGSALQLAWQDDGVWQGQVGLPQGECVFKCVTLTSDGQLAEWEVGDNRSIQVPAPQPGASSSSLQVEVSCRWADTLGTTLSAVQQAGDSSSSSSSVASSCTTAMDTSSSSGDSARGAGVRSHKLALLSPHGSDQHPQQQQQQQGRSCSFSTDGSLSLVSAESSDDAAAGMYTTQLPPQQPGHGMVALTAASLKQAAGRSAALQRPGGAAGAAAQRGPASSIMSSSPFSALTGSTAATGSSSLLSPLGTDVSGQLPPAGASSSTLSFSSLGVSDAPTLDDSSDADGTDDASLAAAAVAAAAAAGPGATDMVVQQQVLDNAAVYEQLMAVEPSLLLQQQQLMHAQAEAALQAVRLSNSSSSKRGGAFAAAAAAAAAADAAEARALIAAAAELCDPASGIDAAALLPSEETLPPTAMAKYAVLSGIREGPDDDDDEQQQQRDAPVRAAERRVSKDQLPVLGLTVNAPSAAAAAAAQMSAATQAAAEAAAAAAKSRASYTGEPPLELPVATEGLRLLASAHCIPHVDKAHTGGEDAFFISAAGHGALGVSDGVSAWAEDGIDPGEYSRTLVAYCAEAYEERVLAAAAAESGTGFVPKFDLRALLRYAQQCTCKPGSATAVLAALQPGGVLHVANLGDSGVKVVRNGRIVHATRPQQHDFNLPYQLSHPQLFPDTDTADSADRYTWQLQEGDVIVAASDGLFDNLWDDELLALLQQGLLGIMPLEPVASLGRAESTGSLSGLGRKLGGRGRHNRSSSTSQLPSLLSAPAAGAAMPVVAAAAMAPTAEDEARAAGMTRSRSTSHLSSWGAKQLRKWKGSSSSSSSSRVQPPPPSAFAAAAAAAIPEQQQQPAGGATGAPLTPGEVRHEAVCRAAELIAAAAAAHAADKEFKSPWSVAAGRAYGLLARLFAKGGKMDDVTCVVAVVQDAARVAAAAAHDAAAPASSSADASSGGRDQRSGSKGRRRGSADGGSMSPSSSDGGSSSIGAAETSEEDGSGASAELQ